MYWFGALGINQDIEACLPGGIGDNMFQKSGFRLNMWGDPAGVASHLTWTPVFLALT